MTMVADMATDVRRLTKRRSLRCCVAALGIVVASVGLQVSGALAATGWTLVHSPDPSATYSVLGAVACTGPTDCWAVGTLYKNGYRTLVVHNDGTGWVRFPSASRGSPPNDQ